MAYVPLIKVVPQFFDNLGNPLVGGTLSAYVAGTTTPTNMFSDNAGTVAGTNVTLDSRGEPTTIKLIWLDTAVNYKFILKDSTSTTIWTIDNIAPSDLVDGSITAAKLANGSVTTAKIADSNVTTVKIADSNITTAKIADLNVTTAKLAANAVTTAKLASGAVTATELASNAVTTVKITDANVTTAKIADANVTPAKLSQPLTSDTAKSSNSGTSVEFTGIPSWVKRISISFLEVSLNGTDDILVTGGIAGSYSLHTYISTSSTTSAASSSVSSSTGGLIIRSANATTITSGIMELRLISAGLWIASFSGKGATTFTTTAGGYMQMYLSGTLSSLKIIPSGANSFDGGSINIMYD